MLTNHWREIFDPAAQIFLNSNVSYTQYKDLYMGLHVHNLGNLPNTVDGRDYFIYVLDYGWKEPLTDALVSNFTNMARMASDTKSQERTLFPTHSVGFRKLRF